MTSETLHSLGWGREKQVTFLSSCKSAEGTRSLKLGCGGHRCTHFLTKGCGRDHRCQQQWQPRGREARGPTSQQTPMMRRDEPWLNATRLGGDSSEPDAGQASQLEGRLLRLTRYLPERQTLTRSHCSLHGARNASSRSRLKLGSQEVSLTCLWKTLGFISVRMVC